MKAALPSLVSHPLVNPEDESLTPINLSVAVEPQSPEPRHHGDFPLASAPRRQVRSSSTDFSKRTIIASEKKDSRVNLFFQEDR